MNDLKSNSTKNKIYKIKSAYFTNNVKILKYFKSKSNNKNGPIIFPKFDIKKSNNKLISNLLNTSKKLVKNNSRYKSYTDLPKSFQHSYPYIPMRNRDNLSAKNQGSSNSNISLISSYNTINVDKIRKSSFIKLLAQENKYKLDLKHFNFVGYNVNEDIFFDFIDGYNNNSKLKEKYNNYLQDHPIENGNDINIFQLFDMLQNFKIDYNDNNFFNQNSASKINKFKLKNNLSVKIKISSLMIAFYKKKRKNINHLNNKDYLFDNSFSNNKLKNKSNNLVTKLKFPFGFLPFFYGINNLEFLKFLIATIDYDFTKCIFYMDFKKFMKNYKLYKKDNTFYAENSYFQAFFNKNKEYFEYDWNIKNKYNKNTNHYIMRIILPQIKINIIFKKKSIAKFYYSIDTNKMIYLLKEKFKLWDFHILKFFSEFKLFRQEINKIICDKLSYGIKRDINNLNENNKSNKFNNILYYKKKFNFNKMNTKLNTLIHSENSFEFFFSHYERTIPEGYFLQLQIPKIHIIYQHPNYLIDKFFDLGIKRMSQINKLRKSFQIEDIIRYSVVFIDEKNNLRNERRKLSSFENNGYRRSIKRSSTLKSNDSFQRINMKTVSTRSSINNSNNMVSSKFKILRATKKENSIKKVNSEDSKKDIKLNLDKYIFNFDDDILKFIKPLEEEKVQKENIIKCNEINKRRIKKENTIIFNNSNILNGIQNKKNLKIEIGKIKLFFVNNDLKEYEYFFEENESSYLLDNKTYIWEKYIEKNLDTYINNNLSS